MELSTNFTNNYNNPRDPLWSANSLSPLHSPSMSGNNGSNITVPDPLSLSKERKTVSAPQPPPQENVWMSQLLKIYREECTAMANERKAAAEERKKVLEIMDRTMCSLESLAKKTSATTVPSTPVLAPVATTTTTTSTDATEKAKKPRKPRQPKKKESEEVNHVETDKEDDEKVKPPEKSKEATKKVKPTPIEKPIKSSKDKVVVKEKKKPEKTNLTAHEFMKIANSKKRSRDDSDNEQSETEERNVQVVYSGEEQSEVEESDSDQEERKPPIKRAKLQVISKSSGKYGTSAPEFNDD